jgi:TolB protein
VAFASVGALDGTNALNTNQVFNIWTAKADGSLAAPLTRLASAGAYQDYPAWSPDGKKIAFVAQRAMDGSDAPSPTDSENLWVINADGSGAAPLTGFASLGSPSLVNPIWSPDGSKLAFGSNQALDGTPTVNAGGAFNVWTTSANGAGSMAVTRLTASGLDFVFAPVIWSADSRRLIMGSQRAVDGSNAANPNANFNLWLLQADGSSAVPLTKFTSGSTNSLEFSLKR